MAKLAKISMYTVYHVVVKYQILQNLLDKLSTYLIFFGGGRGYMCICCILTFFPSLLLPAPPLSCPSFLNDHVTILGGVPLHLPKVDVRRLHDVSQTRPRLKHLVEIP